MAVRVYAVHFKEMIPSFLTDSSVQSAQIYLISLLEKSDQRVSPRSSLYSVCTVCPYLYVLNLRIPLFTAFNIFCPEEKNEYVTLDKAMAVQNDSVVHDRLY